MVSLIYSQSKFIKKETWGYGYYRQTVSVQPKFFSRGMQSLGAIFNTCYPWNAQFLDVSGRVFPNYSSRLKRKSEKDYVVRTVIAIPIDYSQVIVGVILAVTVIGLPIAAILGMFFIIALITSGLFVFLLHRELMLPRDSDVNTGEMGMFILDRSNLVVLKLIPILGYLC